jgi:sodium transport system ATP-binding protein
MIELDQITRQFGDVLAVDQLSLKVSPGEIYGLLGPNGAGKTTTLRMVLGLLVPTVGQVRIGHHRVSEDSLTTKRLLGLVSASSGLYQWLTPRELLAYFGTGYGLTAPVVEQQIDKLAELMGLSDFLDRRCAGLSTGQKQRVNLARSLIHDPPVVLMDEPTRGLDVVAAKVVFDYVNRLRDENKAVVVCTHQLEEAERLCDRFGLLHRGRLCYEGTLPELQEQSGQNTLVEMFLSLLNEQKEAA